MTDPLILVLDEGTTSTRAMAFAPDGTVMAAAQRELTQHFPRPGWVEHDAHEIWAYTLACARQVVEQVGGAGHIAAIGLTNQRETVVAWDRDTGEPLARAIVWQDRRTADACIRLRQAGHEPAVRASTGLLLDPYFSATKMRWLIDNEPAVTAAAGRGSLALGTVESWLVYRLSGNQAFVTDASNASRTLLLSLEGADFDPGLCDLFGVPLSALPQVIDNAGALGLAAAEMFGRAIPICGMAGDQQSATVGQGCLVPGDCKATYGSGAFVLTNCGTAPPQSSNRLLGTVLCQLGGARHYALEGSVFTAGSLIQWLRDSLGVIASSDETEALARSVPDNGGVVVIPAHSGLGAPHWLPEARGLIAGLSFATGRAHVVRACLEAMAHQTLDLAAAFAADGAQWGSLRIDGGMVANDWIAQDIADLTGLEVTRPDCIETTALGAAMLAAYGAGLYPSLEEAVHAMKGTARRFSPQMGEQARQQRIASWERAIARV